MGKIVEFEQAVAAHRDRVYRTIVRLVHDPAEAQDLTQETFTRAYRGWSKFRGQASPSTWLVRIARNLAVDRYRRGARRPDERAQPLDAGGGDELTAAASLTPAQAAEQRLSGECVQRCVGLLPEAYRQAVELRDLRGLNNPDSARMLGLPLETVKMRVHRGREQLRATFAQRCEVYRDERNEMACRPAGAGC